MKISKDDWGVRVDKVTSYYVHDVSGDDVSVQLYLEGSDTTIHRWMTVEYFEKFLEQWNAIQLR